ncbi:MAG: cell division protein ZapA [Devosia sp.]
MPEVSVEIDGKKYRMGCEDGQQQHLLDLAAQLNSQIESLRSSVGEAGDTRLLVMAGIASLDRLAEAERQIDTLKRGIAELTEAGHDLALENEELERRFAARLEQAAERVEAAAAAMDEAGTPHPPAE